MYRAKCLIYCREKKNAGENAEAVAATGVDVLVTTWAYFGKPADIKMVVSA